MIYKLSLAIILIFTLALPALAQDGGDKLPPTAAEGVQWLAIGLATLGGLLAYAVTDAFRRIPWLKDEEKFKISGPMANLVAAVVSVGSGYLLGYLGQAAGFLDQSGLWQVVIFTWPAAKGWFEVAARRNSVTLQPLLEEIQGGPGSG